MIALSPAVLLTRATTCTIDRTVNERRCRRFLSTVDKRRSPQLYEGWSIAFIHWLGVHAYSPGNTSRSAWPLPLTGDAEELARFAESRGVLSRGIPAPGDISLTWSPVRRRFIRGGIVVRTLGVQTYPSGSIVYECLTVEGDTDSLGMPHGPSVREIARRLCPKLGDRTIRWTGLAAGVASTQAARGMAA